MRTITSIKHTLYQTGDWKHYENPYWKVWLTLSDGTKLEIHFEYNYMHCPTLGWWMGYLKDPERKNNTWISFGFSNYVNELKYILKAMLDIILNDDWTFIRGSGHCVKNPNGDGGLPLSTSRYDYYRPSKSNVEFDTNDVEDIAYEAYPHDAMFRVAFIRGFEKAKELYNL